MRILETERLVLRTISLDDANRIEELAGDYNVAKSTLNIPHPYPEGSAVSFIEMVQKAEENGKIVMFSIIESETQEVIGLINLNVAPSFGRGELAYWVGKQYWGSGFGTEAAKAVLEYGFNELDLNKIFAASFTTNPGSWKIMEKIGMKYVGTLKQHVARFGEFYDLVYYELLQEEFSTNKLVDEVARVEN